MKKCSLFLLLLLFVLGIGHRPAQAMESRQSATEIFSLINTFRTGNGLPAFQYNGALAAAAQNQANYMAANTVFSSHIGAGGSTPQSRAEAAGFVGYVTENIVGGTGMSAGQGLNWWINSPVHYNGLISTRHTAAGTGFASNGEQNFFVLVIGQPSNAPPTGSSNRDSSPAPLIITPITLAVPAEDGSITHVVQEGQALWTLAAYYEVPLTDLLLFNNLQESDVVQPGDRITIQLADGAAPPPTPTPPAVHVVTAGQTLWTLAVIYNVRLGDLMLYNNLNESSLLQPGDEIIVRLLPGQEPPPSPTPIVLHTIQTGETLWDVALRHGLNLDELLALNPGYTADTIIQPGDELRVRNLTPTNTPTATTPPTAPSATPVARTPAAATATPTPQMTTTAVPTSPPTSAAPLTNTLTGSENPGRTTLMVVMGLGLVISAFAGAGIWVLRKSG